MRRARKSNLLLIAALAALSACGGGGSGVASISPPPPAPTPPTPPPPPPAATPVTILAEPKAGQMAVLGVAANGGEWSFRGIPSTRTLDGVLADISADPSRQPAINYTANGVYEIKLPGEAYNPLIHDPDSWDPQPSDPFLVVANIPAAYVTIRSSDRGFRHSALASWWRPDLDMGFTADFGSLAFGVPTPEGAVPLTGSATYQGVVSGWTDAKFSDSSGHFPLYSAEGTVALDFNFGTGTLGGRMVLSLPAGGMNPIEVGSYAFRQTIFSAGRTTYSGSFDTSLTGLNFFNGRFTGPAAQETIGHWAVPFTFEGRNHQAIGAWVAKRGE